MEDHWRHVKEVADSVSTKALADLHTVSRCNTFDNLSDFVELNSRTADRYRLVECLLGTFNYFKLNLLFRLPVEDSQVVVPVISIDVARDINVYLVSKIKRSGCGYSMDEALVD